VATQSKTSDDMTKEMKIAKEPKKTSAAADKESLKVNKPKKAKKNAKDEASSSG